jgi:predicted AlkP superfamily pyrophosphatase or phosphodiesterase
MKIAILSLLWCLFCAVGLQARPALVMVLVVDGLRPDSVTPEVMPNLHRLKTNGVWYTRAHSVFPTVTRVNTTSITTGMLPSRHGIASNAIYLPEVSPSSVLSNGEYRNLLKLGDLKGGRVVNAKTLHEYLQDASISYIALSSGSTGNGLLLNATAPYGNGRLINPAFEDRERVAFPDSLNTELVDKFGTLPDVHRADHPMLWVERVLREYVLGTLRPQVIANWMGHSDSAQHQFGVGSPEALTALRLVDEQIGLLLQRLEQLELADKTDIIVTSDHGFDHEPRKDLLGPIQDAGLTDDVVVDNEGGSSLLYLKNRDARKIEQLVQHFQAADTTNAIFVPAKRPDGGKLSCANGAVKGFVPGTFALELAALCLPERGPDMIVTHRWSSDPNPFGVAGTQWIHGKAGQAAHNGHGGLNPYVTRSTLLAVGPDFAQGKVLEIPAGNPDITPTILALLGLKIPDEMDGRVLHEALRTNSKTTVESSTIRHQVKIDGFCSEIEISETANRKYLDSARRCDAGR